MPIFDSLQAGSNLGLLVLRIVIALIFVIHSLPKLKQPGMMAKGLGMPASAVTLLGLVELVGGVGVGIGLFPRLCAIVLSVVMLGAMYYKIMVWKVPFSAHDKTGWEFDLLILAANIIIITAGSGTISL